jgi:leader peptidase (prepilin peptidase)/N-methyltransferase
MLRILGTIFAAVLGLAFGSFLNVCLSRWPEGESVVAPRSHCRGCGRTLAWWENVPLLSWLALRGRCRTCGIWIGWRSPLVEAAVAGLWAFVAARLLPGSLDPLVSRPLLMTDLVLAVASMLFLWLLVALAVLDAENLWLPDWLTLPGTVLGIAANWLRFKLSSDSVLSIYGALEIQQRLLWHMALRWVLGTMAAAGIILLIRWVYWLARKREGIGLGDAKLMSLLAAWLGLPGALLAFAAGVALGTAAALVLLAAPRREGDETWGRMKLPLGTFLCVGGIVSGLWGQPLIAAYLRWAGF